MGETRYRINRRRRETLSLIGAGALTFFPFGVIRAADTNASISCVATPAQTEGPFFVDERLNRADIRSDPATGVVKEGVPLTLRLFARTIGDGACTPLAGALVDVWHCDAKGVYSDVGGPGSRQKFLRGYQT